MGRFRNWILVAALLVAALFVMNASVAEAGHCHYYPSYSTYYYGGCGSYYYTPCYTPLYVTPTYYHGGCYAW